MKTLTLYELDKSIKDFLVFKRALGFRYRRGEATLCHFQRFVQRELDETEKSAFSLEQIIHDWLASMKGCQAVTVSLYLGVIRQFCLYRRRYHLDAYIPEYALAPQTCSTYTPYIFSTDEISKILSAAKHHKGRNIGANMLYTLLLILYCTGLRLGEAVRLCLSDVDLIQCLFVIRESKGRTRLVPFGADLADEIRRYLVERQHTLATSDEQEDLPLFIRMDGTALTICTASNAVRRLLCKLGFKPKKGREGPCSHNFRHAYAVHRLTQWYHQNVDIHAQLPWLSAYMGHVNLLGTEYYLHATPELFEFASKRFEKRIYRCRSTS